MMSSLFCLTPGVIATGIEWSVEAENFMAGQPGTLSLDVAIPTTEKSRDVDGLGLWRLGLFGSRQADGGGQRMGNVNQILNPYHQANGLSGGSPLQLRDITTRFDLSQIGCTDYQYLCVEFDKGQSAQPDFAYKVSTGENTLVSCKPQPCRGVYLTGLVSEPGVMELREGSRTNEIEFSSVASSSPLGGGVEGLNLWRLAVYGSSRPGGTGPRYGFHSQALSSYQGSLPLQHAGDPVDFRTVRTNLDMRGVRCSDIRHICTELSKDPTSAPPFQLMAIPNEDVLKSCFPVPRHACTGLVLSNLDWSIDNGKLLNDQGNDFDLDVRVDSLPGGAQVTGSRLWRVGTFGSKNGDGTGDRLDYRGQILDRRSASTSLTPGSYLQMNNLPTTFDFSKLGCELEYQFFCVEFAKGYKAAPNFNLKFQNSRGNSLVKCKKVECKKPVEITQVTADIVGDNPALVEGSTSNRVMFTFAATTTPDSGSVSGERLWDLSILGSQNPVGDGVKQAVKYLYNFNRYQEAKTAVGGNLISYGFVDTNFDMTGLVCNEVNFICATLRKHDNPSPDFELKAVPDQHVLTDCFRVKCDGKKNWLRLNKDKNVLKFTIIVNK